MSEENIEQNHSDAPEPDDRATAAGDGSPGHATTATADETGADRLVTEEPGPPEFSAEAGQIDEAHNDALPALPAQPEVSDLPARASAPAPARDHASGAEQPIRFSDVVSGQFDADEQAEADVPAALRKRVLAPQPETPKLHKVLAQAGMGSRLDMEQLILEGRISVNNEPAHIGQRIQWGDSVKVNGKPVRFRLEPPPARVLAYHKPAGEVVSTDDPQNRPTVFRKLPRLMQGKWQSVGRLDLNTEGLLLFTSSGEFANRLMHPRFGLEREYAVRVLGALDAEERARLLSGVELSDGSARFGSIEDGGGEGANCWYRVTITEGRNREVRRMFECVGHAVSRLIRIRYGAMLLPRGLRRGGWMELDERDIQQLSRAAGGEERAPRERSAHERQSRPPRRDAGKPAAARRAERRGDERQAGGTGPQQDPLMHQSAYERPASAGRNNRGSGNGVGNGGRPRGPAAPGREQAPARRDRNEPRGAGASAQPDPMKTAFGYIGADSFVRQREAPGFRRGPGGGNRSGGGNPGTGGGRSGGGNAGGQRRGGRSR